MPTATRTETAGYVEYVTPNVTIAIDKDHPDTCHVQMVLPFGTPAVGEFTWQEFDARIRRDCVAAGLTVVG